MKAGKRAAPRENNKAPAYKKRAAAIADDDSDSDTPVVRGDDGSVSSSFSGPKSGTLDILPPKELLLWSVRVDSPSAISGAVAATASMLTDVTLWVCNNRYSYEKAKQRADETGTPCDITPFSGLSYDKTDPHMIVMAVSRNPLSKDCVNIYATETLEDGTVVPKEEFGVKISVEDFTNSLRGVKDYQNMAMFQLRDSNFMSIMIVSDARDPYILEIPLKESEPVHETVDGWFMRFEVSMALADFKDVIRKAGLYKAESINLRIHRRYEDKIVFVMMTESYNGSPNLFRGFQAVYTTMLKRSGAVTAETDQVLKRLQHAQECLSASDPYKAPEVQLAESGMLEAESDIKRQIFKMYSSFALPAGFVRPPRQCNEDSALSECEREMRELQEAVWEFESQTATTKPSRNASELLEKVNATAVEVVSSYTPGVRSAPFHKKDILALPCEYNAWFSVKKLQDMMKAPQSASVQLNLPRNSEDPIAIRFDTGDSAYMSWIMAPRVDRE
jgi:hypothetical protein